MHYSGIRVTATNHMDAAKAVYERLIQHPHIDKDRLVIWGVSFGSYFGLQAAAALGSKIAGTAVSFVCHEVGMNALMDMASPSFKMRFMYMAGFEDEAKFDRFRQGFTLMSVASKIRHPVLIQAGEDDELSPIECSDELVAKIPAPKKYVTYEGERHAIGGSSAAQLGENWFTMLADWCRDRIDGKPAPNERVHINALGQQMVSRFR